MSDVYVTKYALTAGKVEQRTVTSSIKWDDGDTTVKVDGDRYTFYRMGRDCFESASDAAADANAKRDKKIASLKKQIAKLEKLDFQQVLA